MFEPGYSMSKQFVAVTAYKVLREHAPATLTGCASDVKTEAGRFGDLGAAGAFTRGAVNCLDKLGYLDGLPGGSSRGATRLFEPSYGMSKQFVAVTVYKVLREHAPGTLAGCASDVKTEADRFGDLGAAGAFTRGAVNCLDKLGYLDGLPGGYSVLSSGSLPPGTCGGKATDPPSRLIDDPRSQDPAWSPDCTKLAYSRGGDIWIADVDGSDRRRITSGSGWHDAPVWSPDGDKIAYVREGDNADGHWVSHIWVANSNGSGQAELTSGDVSDSSPDWSPDGTSIAFARQTGDERDVWGNRIDSEDRIAVMDADGRSLNTLTVGDSWVASPVWSPDGTRIAYVSGGTVRVVGRDGSDGRAIGEGGHPAWSPDGTKLAFTRGGFSTGTEIVAVELSGFGREHHVADLGAFVFGLKWSPDGQRIAFTYYDQPAGDGYDPNGTRYASVVGAAGVAVPIASDCRPASRGSHVTTGFPLPDWAAPSTGRVRVAVLFVDFPDAVARHSTYAELENLPTVQEDLDGWSGGRIDVEFVALHEWLRAEEGWEHYTSSFRGWLSFEASQYSIDLARGKMDFTNIHALMTVFPSDQFLLWTATGIVTAGDYKLPSFRMNVGHHSLWDLDRGEVSSNPFALKHEFLHVLGLEDLYGADRDSPQQRDGFKLVAFDFGIMGLEAYVYLDEASPVLEGQVPLSPGNPGDYWLRFYEMLAWIRWQLGWLGPGQNRCITSGHAEVLLDPLGNDGARVLMAAVPVSDDKVIVAEARAGDRWSPEFANSGVLVYTVNTSNGELPIEILEPDGSEVLSRLPLLTVGESVTVWGYEFRVTSKTGDAYDVTISKAV